MIEKLVTGILKVGVLCIGLTVFGAPALAFDDGLGGKKGTTPGAECSNDELDCAMCCLIDSLGTGSDANKCENECKEIRRGRGDEASFAVEPEGFDVPWSTVGSAASVDESSLSNFATRREVLGIRGSVDRATIVGRWELSDDRFQGPMCPRLRVRYNDNGTDAAVYVRLIRTGVNGGSSTRADFWSENVAQLGWQTQEVDFEEVFDFSEHAYFLETWIHKYGSSGVAELGIVQLDPLPGYCID